MFPKTNNRLKFFRSLKIFELEMFLSQPKWNQVKNFWHHTQNCVVPSKCHKIPFLVVIVFASQALVRFTIESGQLRECCWLSENLLLIFLPNILLSFTLSLWFLFFLFSTFSFQFSSFDLLSTSYTAYVCQFFTQLNRVRSQPWNTHWSNGEWDNWHHPSD